jgi:hypothetical protein
MYECVYSGIHAYNTCKRTTEMNERPESGDQKFFAKQKRRKRFWDLKKQCKSHTHEDEGERACERVGGWAEGRTGGRAEGREKERERERERP